MSHRVVKQTREIDGGTCKTQNVNQVVFAVIKLAINEFWQKLGFRVISPT